RESRQPPRSARRTWKKSIRLRYWPTQPLRLKSGKGTTLTSFTTRRTFHSCSGLRWGRPPAQSTARSASRMKPCCRIPLYPARSKFFWGGDVQGAGFFQRLFICCTQPQSKKKKSAESKEPLSAPQVVAGFKPSPRSARAWLATLQ